MAGARLLDSLDLVLPALPPALVPPKAIPWLVAAAAVLPPVHRAGFECRLAAGSDEVDLQQGIFSTDGEPARLVRFIRDAAARNDTWRTVLTLAERWSTPGDMVHECVSDIWLEFDAPDASTGGRLALGDAAPSVFAVLRDADAAMSLAAAQAFLTASYDGPGADAQGATLARCAAACPDPARVSHVGVMLGRPYQAMRVHVSPVPLRRLHQFLELVGWYGDRDDVVANVATMLEHADLAVVCLDILDDTVMRVGIECFLAHTSGPDPRWRQLLDGLVNLGLSSPDKAKALLDWPGAVTPLTTAGEWPDDLILQSIVRPAEVLGLLDRRLSHVKLTFSPGAPVTAKTYFGYGHIWTADTQDSQPPRHRQVDEAINGGVRFLLRARHQTGWWRDFVDRARPLEVELARAGANSDEWVTAYVAAHLAAVDHEQAAEATSEALDLLVQRREGEVGWGYHLLVPPDADTTTWVLRLARLLGRTEQGPLTAGRGLVESLTDRDGAVHTYPPEAASALAHFTGVVGSYAGWSAPHPCVTAAAAFLEFASAQRSYLGRVQRDDGSWAGYWWDDDEYTTARAVEALSAHAGFDEHISRAVAWSVGRIGDDGAVHSAAHGRPSAFATALALHTIRAAPTACTDERHVAAAQRAERWLVSQQLASGAWEPSARLRIPAPWAEDPHASSGTTWTYIDSGGLFTTATVLAALSTGPASES